MKKTKIYIQQEFWHLWFAWYPVSQKERGIKTTWWLESVWRRYHKYPKDCYEYSEEERYPQQIENRLPRTP